MTAGASTNGTCSPKPAATLLSSCAAAAISNHCLDISEPKTIRGLEAGYRFYTARWALADFPARRCPPGPAPDPDR